MKKLFLVSLILLISTCQDIYANTPTEALQITVNKLIAIAKDKTTDEQTKKNYLTTIIRSDMDFEAISKRVISKPWKKATAEQKKQFKQRFLTIIVNTYFALLNNYSDEKVLFLKEQLKKKKYAIIDTKLISGNKKIPVRYRLIKENDTWKIYDFIPEGISLVSTYKKNYAAILRGNGMDGLIEEMTRIENKKSNE